MRWVPILLASLVGCASPSMDARPTGDVDLIQQALAAVSAELDAKVETAVEAALTADVNANLDVSGVRKEINYGSGDVWVGRIITFGGFVVWPLLFYLGKKHERNKNGKAKCDH